MKKGLSVFIFTYVIISVGMYGINTSSEILYKLCFISLVISALVSSPRTLLITIVQVLPFNNMIIYSMNFYTIIPIMMLIFCWKTVRSNKMNFSFELIILILILFLIQIIVAYHFFSNITFLIPFFLQLLFAFASIKYVVEYDIDIFKISSAIYIVSIILSFFAPIIFHDAALLLATEKYPSMYVDLFYGYRFGGAVIEPTVYAQQIMIAICFIVSLFIENNISSKVATTLIVILMILGYLTYSRVFIIMGVFLLILFLHYNYKYLYEASSVRRLRFKKIIIPLLVTYISMLFGYIFINNMINYRADLNVNNMGITSGRIDLWVNYISLFTRNILGLLFGYGANNIIGISKLFDLHSTPHNGIIEKIFELGVIGSFIFFFIIKQIFRGIPINIKINPRIIFIFVYLLSLMFLSMGNHDILYALIFLVVDFPSLSRKNNN